MLIDLTELVVKLQAKMRIDFGEATTILAYILEKYPSMSEEEVLTLAEDAAWNKAYYNLPTADAIKISIKEAV